MSASRNYIILLGTNTGDRTLALNTAVQHINVEIGPIEVFSPVYETAPWGNTAQDAFLNRVVSGKTTLSPQQLVRCALAIEEKMGRKRLIKWEPRIIDIDLLFLDNEVVSTEELILPHPMLHKRRFTLVPLFDIFPEFRHPVFNKTVRQLLEEVEDPLPVIPFNEKQ